MAPINDDGDGHYDGRSNVLVVMAIIIVIMMIIMLMRILMVPWVGCVNPLALLM